MGNVGLMTATDQTTDRIGNCGHFTLMQKKKKTT